MTEIIHRRKLFGGHATAEEVHQRALGQRCMACPAPALVTIRVFAPQSDLGVDQLAAISVQHDGMVPVVKTQSGAYVRVSTVYACKRCAPTAERAASKHPSAWFVEIDRGPGVDKPTVAVR